MADKKIVFPTDFSTSSDAALDYASRLAKSLDAKLLIVHVEEPPLAYAEGDCYYGITEPDQAALAKMLSDLRPTDAAVACEHRMLIGNPASEILTVAEMEAAELIIMGSHGRRGLSRLVLGSVAEAVAHRAKCPVLIVKCPRRGSN